ncbi:hypothetical protein SNK03_005491 [Fusarium graminearum]|uniref:Uncharacterized protein n=1 Tax=Gibberella zeae TaxID=5518 RepID=A0A679P429_GIBZA|nr:hypothetical protein FG05_02935 [Fusarium graminearum]CAF3457304.1 unnamed protein product [Fusarium graminearum]CAF3472407.1 unnamed protein product [Fusarium graminearum]CAG1978159.1 unnamed protein product [Fusarium graminearum]CAG2002317.1 unnamed protein product [Fusarium graminearum]
MKPIAVLATMAAVFSTATEARACTQGLKYCSFNLLKIGKYSGDYYNEIEAELKRNGLPNSYSYVRNSLFRCASDGWIVFESYCGVCIDGGSGKSDRCPTGIGK